MNRNQKIIIFSSVVTFLIGIPLFGYVLSPYLCSQLNLCKALPNPSPLPILPSALPTLPPKPSPMATGILSNPTTVATDVPKPTNQLVVSVPMNELRIVTARGGVGCAKLTIVSSDQEEILNYANNNDEPSWSPNGKQLVFSAGNCRQSADKSLVVYDLNKRSYNEVLNNGNINADPSWGSDGLIYFSSNPDSNSGNGMISSIRPDGSGLRSIGLRGREPVLSPDGRWLAYMTQESGKWVIAVADISLSQVRCKLTSPQSNDAPHARMPNWTNNGNAVVFNMTNSSFVSKGLVFGNIDTCRTFKISVRGSDGKILGRPSCSTRTNHQYCVANEAEDGGLWLLERISDTEYQALKKLTNPNDWGADIYP